MAYFVQRCRNRAVNPLLVIALLAITGCASVKRDLPEASVALPAPPAERPPYLVQPGDVLESHYTIDNDLNEQALVNPGGRVSFRYASNIPAAGHTLADLRDEVANSAGVTDRGFDVVLRSSAGTRVYVTGEVNTPGEVMVNGDITALQAVSRAGGFKLGAQTGNMVLLRRGTNNRPQLYTVDLKSVLEGLSADKDVELQTYDVLYVPRDRAGNLSLIFERIRQAVPFNFSLIYGDGNASFLK